MMTSMTMLMPMMIITLLTSPTPTQQSTYTANKLAPLPQVTEEGIHSNPLISMPLSAMAMTALTMPTMQMSLITMMQHPTTSLIMQLATPIQTQHLHLDLPDNQLPMMAPLLAMMLQLMMIQTTMNPTGNLYSYFQQHPVHMLVPFFLPAFDQHLRNLIIYRNTFGSSMTLHADFMLSLLILSNLHCQCPTQQP